MKEKNIFGYFQTMDYAQKAAQELKSRGFETVSVDRVAPLLGGNPYDNDSEIRGIFQHQANSLATTALGSPERFTNDQRILAATHQDASGLAGGNGFSHMEDVCVTVITDATRYDEALAILEQYGARS